MYVLKSSHASSEFVSLMSAASKISCVVQLNISCTSLEYKNSQQLRVIFVQFKAALSARHYFCKCFSLYNFVYHRHWLCFNLLHEFRGVIFVERFNFCFFYIIRARVTCFYGLDRFSCFPVSTFYRSFITTHILYSIPCFRNLSVSLLQLPRSCLLFLVY